MTFRESNLQFDFKDEVWSHLMKFDETTDFKLARESVPGTKGVDFSGILEKVSLVLIEVKNFRSHRIENKPRMIGGDEPLWLEVAQKMKDSIAVIIGATRHSSNQQQDWIAYLDILKNKKKQLRLVLWLEQDLPVNRQQKYRSISEEEIFRRKLKSSLKWLTPNVEVVSSESNPFSNALSLKHL